MKLGLDIGTAPNGRWLYKTAGEGGIEDVEIGHGQVFRLAVRSLPRCRLETGKLVFVWQVIEGGKC